jgi:hypothetical protein
MKVLGILLIVVGAFMYLSLIMVLAGYWPAKGTIDSISFVSPLVPIGLGVAAIRKARANRIKNGEFTL